MEVKTDLGPFELWECYNPLGSTTGPSSHKQYMLLSYML